MEEILLTGSYFPMGSYFGVSAATGDLTYNHDVISIKMNELDTEGTRPGVQPPLAGSPQAAPAHAEASADADDSDYY